jgi:hypothetical protein
LARMPFVFQKPFVGAGHCACPFCRFRPSLPRAGVEACPYRGVFDI